MIRYLLLYYTGLLPFVKIDHHEVFAMPYMTRDYLRMKIIEAKEKSSLYYLFIVITVFANWTNNGMIEHLNKRGLHTNYWVINDDDEIKHVALNTKVKGIMTDRPTAAAKVLESLKPRFN